MFSSGKPVCSWCLRNVDGHCRLLPLILYDLPNQEFQNRCQGCLEIASSLLGGIDLLLDIICLGKLQF